MRSILLETLRLIAIGGLVFQATALPPGFEDEGIFRVTAPVDIAFVDTFILLVASDTGTLFSFDLEDPNAQPNLALDLSDRVCTNGERGYVVASILRWNAC